MNEDLDDMYCTVQHHEFTEVQGYHWDRLVDGDDSLRQSRGARSHVSFCAAGIFAWANSRIREKQRASSKGRLHCVLLSHKLTQQPRTEQAGWSGSGSWGARFKSKSGHRLFWLGCYVTYRQSAAECRHSSMKYATATYFPVLTNSLNAITQPHQSTPDNHCSL
jgi:hypothetical protein